MRLYRAFAFVFTSAATGLAAAFLLVLLRPDLVSEQPTAGAPTQAARPRVTSYADAVAAAAPAVVNVFATKLTQERRNPLLDDPFFRRFFGEPNRQPRFQQEQSLGSGVLVDPNGYILTNHHVIEGANEIRVVIGNSRRLPVRVVGVDSETDLAVLQVGGGHNLPVARLGTSQPVRVGDVVLAIGNPFAVGQTVTMGIVSATGRDKLGITNFESFIQTDAAINPGNSGGALINADGDVVGINTAIFSQSGWSHGIGFAIPMQIAQNVMRSIIDHGRMIRGWLGITGQDLTPALSASLELEVDQGILVSEVLRDGPAAAAGMQPGDVIVRIDATEIVESAQLLNLVAARRPGETLRLQILRDGARHALVVRVTERPAEVER
jgi:Do/DeqQ family serine protease